VIPPNPVKKAEEHNWKVRGKGEGEVAS